MIKKFIFFLLSLIFISPFVFSFNQPVYAASLFKEDCSISYEPSVVNKDTHAVTVTIDTQGQAAGSNYNLVLWRGGSFGFPGGWAVFFKNLTANDGKITAQIPDIQAWLDETGKQVQVNLVRADERGGFNENIKCRNKLVIPVNTISVGSAFCAIDFQDQSYNVDPKSADFDPTKFMRPGNSIKASVNCPTTNQSSIFCKEEAQSWDVQVYIKNGNGTIVSTKATKVGELKTGYVMDPLEQGNYLLDVQVPIPVGIIETLQGQHPIFECSKGFVLDSNGGGAGCSSDNDCLGNPNGRYCLPDTNGSLSCQETKDKLAINPCVTKGNDFVCQTAIGAIGTSASTFAKGVLQLFLGLAGVILLFMIILNGYKFMTSQGDPEKVKEARESITSAIAGLLVIIFAVVILQLITVDILHLPGFGK